MGTLTLVLIHMFTCMRLFSCDAISRSHSKVTYFVSSSHFGMPSEEETEITKDKRRYHDAMNEPSSEQQISGYTATTFDVTKLEPYS